MDCDRTLEDLRNGEAVPMCLLLTAAIQLFINAAIQEAQFLMAFFSLADPTCALPHLSSATWKAWNGSALQLEPLLRAVAAPPSKKRKYEDVKTEESGKAKAPRP